MCIRDRYFGEPQDRVAVDSTLDYSTCGLPGYEDAGTVQTEILSYSNVLFMFFVCLLYTSRCV